MRAVGAVPSSVKVGILATLSMDAVFLAAARVGGDRFSSDKIAPEVVGRWVAGLARGRYRHDDLTAEPPVRGEMLLGLAVHYLTGVGLTAVYLESLRQLHRRPGTLSGALYGTVTACLPWLVMYPSWGLGPFGSRSGEAGRLIRIMLLGHTAFGAAVGGWAQVSAVVKARP